MKDLVILLPEGWPEDRHGGCHVWPDDVPLPLDEDGDRHFVIETSWGVWGQAKRIKGFAVTARELDRVGVTSQFEYTVHGDRAMYHPRESGYQMEGWVSLGGRKRRAFTGSILVRYRGKLHTVAVLHVRSGD